MTDYNGKKFYQELLEIDGHLGKDEVEALKFLCADFMFLKKLESVESARDLFLLFMKEDFLNKDETFLVAELLYRIRNISVLRKFGYSKEDVERDLPQRGRVSDYRQMLFEISEDFTADDLLSTKFLMRERLPKGQSIKSALEILVYLEKQDLLAKDKLDVLEEICQNISPELLNKVTQYKLKQGKEVASSPVFGFGQPSRSYDFNRRNVNCPSVQSLTQPGGDSELKPAVEDSVMYKMDGPHRGFCLIFNNIEFKDQRLGLRRGSQKDASELEHVFKWLGLDVYTYDNKTSEEMKGLLQQWQSDKKLKDGNCLVCCILSHGKSGQIYGTDEVLISIRSITSYFTAKRCPQLAEKPKLFFIQACQGEKIQKPVFLDADKGDSVPLEQDAQSSEPVSSQSIMKSSIPEEADFLLGMATVDGYLSFRHIHQGAWYIQALCKKLQELVPRGEDILSILTAVNADVSTRADRQGQIKQMPQPAYTLRKKLIFPVPTGPPLL